MDYLVKGNHDSSPNFYQRDVHGVIVWPKELIAQRKRLDIKKVGSTA